MDQLVRVMVCVNFVSLLAFGANSDFWFVHGDVILFSHMGSDAEYSWRTNKRRSLFGLNIAMNSKLMEENISHTLHSYSCGRKAFPHVRIRVYKQVSGKNILRDLKKN